MGVYHILPRCNVYCLCKIGVSFYVSSTVQHLLVNGTWGDELTTQKVMNEKGQINIILHDNKKLLANKGKENNKLSVIDHYFSNFIGLNDMKDSVKGIYASKLINIERERLGLSVQKQVLHMIFTGNPGTGKTTVARKLATVFLKLNLLTKGQFVEAERADLVGEYIGQTAQKTRNLIERSLGGVLFIDEAYSLARGGTKDFGREAIDTLVKQMEDYASEFVLILAGYPKEMGHFLQMNPGLESRFPFVISFRDYSIDELMEIANQLASEREYELTPQAKWKLRHHVKEILASKPPHFANARYVRNIVERGIRNQAIRLVQKEQLSFHDLLYIEVEDLHFF